MRGADIDDADDVPVVLGDSMHARREQIVGIEGNASEACQSHNVSASIDTPAERFEQVM
jgi:hypothetical protein